jgi:Ca2+-binding RTX toxin-like protein
VNGGRSRRRIGLVTAFATLLSYAITSLPAQSAHAADAETTALRGLVTSLDGFVPGLAGVGSFGTPLTTLDVAPGSARGIGLDDLLSNAESDVLGSDYTSAADVGALTSAIDGADGGTTHDRHVTYTANKTTAGTVDSIAVTMHATRTVTDARLDISDDSPKFSLASDGGVDLTLTMDLAYVLNWDSNTGAVWLTRTTSTPAMSIAADGVFSSPLAVEAGLGILAVELDSGSTYQLHETSTTSWSDPNNDGRLAFDEPNGTPGDGELAAAGAGAGLVTATTTSGTLHAHLNIVGRPSTAIDLGDAQVSVDVDDGDLTTDPGPQVTVASGSLDDVRAFLTLSNRDLAQGLAQAASTVLGLERATGIKLPFMRGDVADAISATQSITDYLTAHVPAPTPDQPTPGLPDFASLQDMLEQLDAINGDNVVDVSGATYDATKRKVSFTLDITHDAPPAPGPDLNPTGTPISGTANYTATKLTDTGKAFTATLIGRQVNAGTSSGVIASVSGDTLTLSPEPVTNPQNLNPTNYWNGGTPPDGTAYSIAAADPKIGAVELGDVLSHSADGAIRNANAKSAQATVQPSFSLHLPIVLDLRDADTSDCDPGPGTAACPFSYTANGLTQVITSLPRTADRIMLHTSNATLLTADAPIATKVDIDATVGFLGVRLKGDLKECTTSGPTDCTGSPASGDHLLTIALKPVDGADTDGDIPFTSYVTKITQALAATPPTFDQLVGVTAQGQAWAHLEVSVPGASDFFGGSPTAGVDVTMPDITAPDGVNVTPTAQLGDLGTFNLDPSNPLALFGALLSDLQAVQGVIGKFPGAGQLDKPIPLIGKSFNDVVSEGASGGGDTVTWSAGPPGTTMLVDTDKTFTDAYVGRHVHVGSTEAAIVSVDPTNDHRVALQPALTPVPADGTSYTIDSELQGVINLLQNQSSNNLQEMLDLVATKLGHGSTVGFQVVNGTPDQLKLIVHWKRAYHSTSALNVKFDLPSGTQRSLIGAQGQGLLDIDASGEIDLSLLIPLDTSTFADPANALTIDPSASTVKAGIAVNGDGVKLAANLGPFAVSLGDPTDGNAAGTLLRAGLGVSLSSPDSTPESLADFVSNLDVVVDGDGVTCDGAPSGSDPLAACAVFPAYLNGAPVNADPTVNNFVVRLPLNTSDLADTFDVTGPDLDGGNPRFVAPDGLLTALQGAALNLTAFGDGFYGYLDFVERTLRTASFDGKLPLVGKDLQAGSEFIHGLHTDIATALGGVDPTATNAGQIRTFLKDKVKPALPVLPGGDFTFDVECTTGSGLAQVGTPSVSPSGGGSGATYQYKVVAYAAVGGDDQETLASDASSDVTNNPVSGLDTTHLNSVSWTAVDGANGYHVYRSVDGGDFLLVQDVTGQASATWDDSGAADGAVLVPATSSPCPDSTPADGVQGFTMAVDIGQGDVSDASQGCVDRSGPDDPSKHCLGGHLPFDLGIPGLSISSTSATDAENGIQVGLGWKLHLKVGLNRDDGFFVQTQDTDKPELQVGLKVDVGDVQARLAFINIDKTKHVPSSTTPDFVGRFVIDLKDGPGAADCTATCTAQDGPGSPRLTLDKLTSGGDLSDFVKPLVTANVDLDWHLAARPGTGSALPGISTNFLLTWAWTSDSPSDIGGLDIAFNDVKIDAGEFLGGVIKPIIQQVVDVLKPVQPVIDILFEPIPVISDLSEAVGGDPVTIASLAQTFSTLAGGPDLQPFLDVIKNVRDLVKSLSGNCSPDPSPCITVGSFPLVTSKAIDTDANPATAQSLIKDSGSGYDLHSDVKDQVNDKASKPIDQNGSDAEHPGFSFPFLDKPSSIFGLLVGQDVDLVKFDSGPLTLGFEFQESFGPVYAPPPVNIVVGGGASVTLRIVAGFDTYGIRTAVERGKVDAQILDSLFFYTTDDDGKPLPVVQFTGFLEAGASVSAVIIEVGVVGGIKLTISFYWNDPNNDGKFRFSEFLAAALTNPICLFNVGGELSLFVKVFITLGFSPFSVSFDFTLVDVKLLDFSLKPDCTPPPPKLGGVNGDVLYLFAGKYGTKAQRAPGYVPDYPFDNKGGTADEAWVVRQVPAVPAKAAQPDPDGAGPKLAQPAQEAENAKVTVTALGISEDFDDSGNAIHTVVLDGRGYAGALQVTFNGGTDKQPFDKKVVVATGSGKDVVRTGIGRSVVDVGDSDDRVTTLERTDLSQDPATAPKSLVSGGPGVDAISVGNGEDTVFGDRSLVFHDQGSPVSVKPASGSNISLSGVLDPANVDQPGDPGGDQAGGANDQIAAGLGGSTIYGNNGPDKIGTANDNPQADLPGIANPGFYRARSNTIVGGSGGDQIKSGSAADVIFTGAQDDSAKNDVGPNNTGSGDAASDENSVDTGTGTDTVYGSNAKDYVATHSTVSQTATVYGGGADDVLIGALGTDKLYGGPGDDYLVAGPATISAGFPVNDVLGSARQVTLTPVAPPISAKTLVGGGGRDRIYGVDGPATIFGDHEIDGCARQSNPVSAQPPEHPTTGGPAADNDAGDLILGGAGIDTVQAGGGNDHVFLAGADDVACGNAGNDEVFGGDGADLAYGGSGDDQLNGENGTDELYGNTGADSAYGGAQNDRVQGNEGSDFLTGGTGDDVVVGGTSKAGTPDKGDRIYGDEGNDVLIGDNGVPDPTPTYPADLANTDVSPTIGGPDFVFGGDGDDRAFGGLDADNVYGGNGADYLEGNNASDHVWGEAGADDIIGGSSQEASSGVGRPDAADALSGGADDDVIAGDNAQLAKVGAQLGSPLTRGRGLTSERSITLLDLGSGAASGLFGGDTITGDGENDVVLGERGADQIHGNGGDDYLEGGQDGDTIDGDAGSDDIVGGEFTPSGGSGATTIGQPDTGDVIRGGTESDVVLGDNGAVLRDPAVAASDLTKGRGITQRAIQPYDLGDNPTAGTSGGDLVNGNDGVDVMLGQDGPDRLLADAGSDYAEGGPGTDWIEGGDGSDDLVGGSSTILAGSGATAKGQPDTGDMVWGQAGDDVATGDNAVITRVAPFNDLTFRIGIAGTIEERRAIRLLDLDNNGIRNAPDAIRFGADELSGQAGVDVLLGQDGNDAISGGSADDYAEGQGADDIIYGDRQLAAVGIPPLSAAWPGTPTFGYDGDGLADGQDDLIGGKSQPGFRDGNDTIHGDGSSDFVLGDNGTSVRDIRSGSTTIGPNDQVPPGTLTDRIYTVRYPSTLPAGAANVRHHDPAQPAPTPRFCSTAQATCEPVGAFGNDTLFGDGGDDFLYGQDGNDTARGGDDDDDVYGDLGNDTLYGDAGDDAVLGDRGGVRDVYQGGGNQFFMSVTQVPKVEFTGFPSGSVTRVTDLLHDVDGDVFVGSGISPAMPHPGLNEGGDDRIRGGTGHDSIHASFGDDLANGDSGGDWVFGDDGADVLWGGKGCDAQTDTPASAPICFPGGTAASFDPAPHTAAGETQPSVTDYVVGGKGGTSAVSLAGSSGSDVIDWRPRGTYAPGTGCTTSAWPVDLNSGGKKGTSTTVDPCSWFEMTDINDADDTNNQHHQGVDWQYGGWDRDILQGDQADNGPNEGDRLLDWNGAYNLYTHCNSAYGGYNDVRQHSPAWQDFLQRWVYAQGAGQAQADATTAGTSAFVELALVYPGSDNAHGSGSAYPSTPGHFDNPNACAP